MVDVDFCLPLRQIAEVLVQLIDGKATNTTESTDEGNRMDQHASAERTISRPPGEQIPVSCPECNGPLYEVTEGKLARFQCFVGHSFAPESLSEQQTDALERALWTAIRRLKERVVLHQELIERKKRNKAEEELRARLEESVATAESDLKLLREIVDRI
jgi:two-component system chemotaxis response regulator CheB